MNKSIIENALAKLSKRRPVFQSEAGLKCGLSREIEKLLPTCTVWHEYPASLIKSDMYTIGSEDRTNPRIDMVVVEDDTWYPIEVKYIKGKFDLDDYQFSGGDGKDKAYNFVADIKRLEFFSSRYAKSKKGYAIIVTNNKGWYDNKKPKNNPGENTFEYDSFFLNNNRTLSGEVRYKSLDKEIKKENDKKKFFTLNDTYDVNWRPYSKIQTTKGNGEFKYLLIEVN